MSFYKPPPEYEKQNYVFGIAFHRCLGPNDSGCWDQIEEFVRKYVFGHQFIHVEITEDPTSQARTPCSYSIFREDKDGKAGRVHRWARKMKTPGYVFWQIPATKTQYERLIGFLRHKEAKRCGFNDWGFYCNFLPLMSLSFDGNGGDLKNDPDYDVVLQDIQSWEVECAEYCEDLCKHNFTRETFFCSQLVAEALVFAGIIHLGNKLPCKLTVDDLYHIMNDQLNPFASNNYNLIN